ncbi:receptor mediated endocytosis protein-like protein, partial [Reticulomyxa filosa]
SFLNRFEVSELEAPLLEHITLIDSPGILSGEKQRIQRGYDFASVVSYWATRADRILLLFDAHKLDISDELKEAILAIRGNFDKIRCVLNKADQVNQQQLMRMYVCV